MSPPLSSLQTFKLGAAKTNEPFPRSCVKLIVNFGIRRQTKPFPLFLLSCARVSIDRPVSRLTVDGLQHHIMPDSNNKEHLALSDHHSGVIRKENSLNPFAIGGTCICCSENVMILDKSYRGITEIALAPDFFQLTSLALRQGLTSNLPLSSWAQVYPNSSALQRGR